MDNSWDLLKKVKEARDARSVRLLSGVPSTASFVKGSFVRSERFLETYKGKVDKTRNRLALGNTQLFNSDIDISWLPAAAESYHISADPKDYVLVEVPLVTVDIPNRNLQAFPFEEVSYFDPLYGRMIYSTFIGKPTHIDHQNKDPLKAKGVNFDASLRYVPEYDVWKIFVLSGFDRTKDPHLVDQILRKKRTGYSMGALVENFVCSISGAVDTNIKPSRYSKGQTFQDHLAYQICVGVNYIENSSVEDPADVTAYTEQLW